MIKFILLLFVFVLLIFLHLLSKYKIESFLDKSKYNLVFVQYFKNKNSFICDKDKIWGNWVQSSFLMEILEDLSLNKISCNLEDIPKKVDILIIGFTNVTVEKLDQIIKNNNPKIVFFLSDSHGTKSKYHNILKKAKLVYREHNWNSYPCEKNIKLLPLGYHCWDENYINYENQIKPINKKYIWCFMGSNKGERKNNLNIFKSKLKPYFHEKTKIGENSEIYNQSIFALCLRGNNSIDCFRQYTSSKNGCIPIIICNLHDYQQSYGKYTEPPPFLRADTAIQAIEIINNLLNNYEKINELHKKQNIWWSNIKNEIKENVNNALK